mmetsp:Transcript_97931/g.247108  ORF Transcript_97931/g.247108 Transcript_97931/m.247108 type:complete len:227 (-) Transcript_97931:180-860(-)
MTDKEPWSNRCNSMKLPTIPRMETHIKCLSCSSVIWGGTEVAKDATSPHEYMTPLGKPVEPEVLKTMHGCSGDTVGGSMGVSLPSAIMRFKALSPSRNRGSKMLWQARPPGRAKGAYWAWSHTTSFGSYIATMARQSCTRRSVAKGTNETPSFKQLRSKTANSGRFSAIVTTLSPACTPKPIRLRTKRLESASKFLKVKRSSGPTPSKTIASKSAYLSTACAHRIA